MTKIYRRTALALLALLWGGGLGQAQTLPPGNVAVTRARGDAIAIWDATPALTELVANKASKKEALARLKADASLVFGIKASKLKKIATTLSIIVLYSKTGAISPTYHVATFEGVERLFVFKATTRTAGEAKKWSVQLLRGEVPRAVSIVSLGQLPPELR